MAQNDKNINLYHHGVKGMKWGHRKAVQPSVGARLRSGLNSAKDAAQKGVKKAKKEIKKHSNGEVAKRGKAALDVLMNGDTDWMGNHSYSDDAVTEAKNRGKAAIERLMYSQEQIDNKKFFGRYDF